MANKTKSNAGDVILIEKKTRFFLKRINHN